MQVESTSGRTEIESKKEKRGSHTCTKFSLAHGAALVPWRETRPTSTRSSRKTPKSPSNSSLDFLHWHSGRSLLAQSPNWSFGLPTGATVGDAGTSSQSIAQGSAFGSWLGPPRECQGAQVYIHKQTQSTERRRWPLSTDVEGST